MHFLSVFQLVSSAFRGDSEGSSIAAITSEKRKEVKFTTILPLFPNVRSNFGRTHRNCLCQ